jgi:Zn-dependent protease
MILDILRGNGDGLSLIITFFSRLFVIFCTMPIHEYAHALIATKLGDQTPRLSGRLTLNPMAHISPLGAIMIFICGFGYAKPVNVNPRNFKDPKKGMALTAIAGPVSNLIMGFICIFLATAVGSLGSTSSTMIYAIYYFLTFAGVVNVNLAVFNLLPIPPLDGSRILQLLIPAKYYYKFLQYERYIVLVVFVLIMTGVLSKPLSLISNLFITLFSNIAGLIF